MIFASGHDGHGKSTSFSPVECIVIQHHIVAIQYAVIPIQCVRYIIHSRFAPYSNQNLLIVQPMSYVYSSLNVKELHFSIEIHHSIEHH